MNPIAGFAGGFQQMIHGKAVRAVNEANNRLSQQNAESRNRLRQVSNAAEAAKGNLQRWVQSVNNNRRLDSGGEALEANTVNARRQGDQALTSSFSQSLQAAEQAGQMASSAAFSGVTGDVVDMVNTSAALRDSIVRQGFSDRMDMASNDIARRAGNIMSQMVGGLDSSVLLESMDYNIDVATYTPSLSSAYNFVQGAMKGMGMGAGLDGGGGQSVYQAGETHGTDFTGRAKFSFQDDSYLSLDENFDGGMWTDRALGETSARGSNPFTDQFTNTQNDYSNAWRSSGTDLGGAGSAWSW